jgi:predicted metal-binding protein
MSADHYQEWRKKSEIDYVPQLLILWLSTNSWYKSHYSEIVSKIDRDFLNKLRDDHSTRNKLFTRFKKILEDEGTKDHVELNSTIEALFFALNRALLRWEEDDPASAITFENCLLIHKPKTYGSLLVKKQVPGIKISKALRITDDKSAFFNGLLEIIYIVRCQLVHGQLKPNDETHEAVKQVYLLLRILMSFN